MKHKLISLVLVLLSFNSYSDSNDDNIITSLNNNFNRSLLEIDNAYKQCKQKQNKLPTKKLLSLQIDKLSMKTALLYYHFAAMNECEKSAVNDYLINATLLQVMDNTSTAKIAAAHQLIMNGYILSARAKSEFDILAPEIKNKLDTIAELKQPFDILSEIKSLELDKDD